MDARISWHRSHDADGHNVRWGSAPDRLSSCWQVRGVTALDLGALTAGMDYWVAVDAFNANGVTRGAPVPVPPWIPGNAEVPATSR